MKSIIDVIKTALPFMKEKKEAVTEYVDLAPVDKIENGAEYLNALEWALDNKKVKNIALAGPYGSGKSSIIETYLRKHPEVQKKSLRISMATFAELVFDKDGNPQKIEIGQDEIELGILKQLFYKVDHKRIPQSRYRKLHKISFWRIWGCLVGLSIFISLMVYIFFPMGFSSTINKVVAAGSAIAFPSVLSFMSSSSISLIMFGILVLSILACLAAMYRSILSRFRIKEIKLPVDATVKSGEESSEAVFDKFLDEIVYFFEETNYQVVFFEDLDRLENSSVFVHLRELNTLLNNYSVIKNSIVFVYAVKDDIFSDTDRTKFFEFIIPVIPIINSTNSGEILLEKLNQSKKIGVHHDISLEYVLDVAPYISDMRILQNIYNEFIVYKKILREGQDLKLLDEPMLALIIFKNLYPRDFSDIQMEEGVIKQAFSDKQERLKSRQDAIQGKIDELTKILHEIPTETLKSIKELKAAFLCEITNWMGIAIEVRPNGHNSIRGSEIIQDTFDLSQWADIKQCSGSYRNWDGGGGYSFFCNTFLEACASYLEREKGIRLIEESRIAEAQREIEVLKLQLHDISSWPLKRLVEQYSSEKMLSDEVTKNKLLVFLLRRGYIDERYTNYINYFKGNTVTKEDMNFILSVKNMEPQPSNYELTKISMIAQRLQIYEFGQKEVYNFALLEYLLGSDAYNAKLNVFVKQLADEDEWSWKFIDEFVNLTKYQNRFINLLAFTWPNMWGYITDNAILTYERKIRYLSLLISNVDIEKLILMNSNNEMSDFFEQNEDILQQLASVDYSKVIRIIGALKVVFKKVSTEKVPDAILAYIFDNNCYELNPLMILRVVEYKNKDLVPDLESRNYTTIVKLGYTPLIKYVRARENLAQYIETMVLIGENALDAEEQIIDLLRRNIDNKELCVKIIVHEEFCLGDIEYCCKDQIEENKSAVKSLWDTLLKNNKVISTWENVNRYWAVYGFSQELITFIENHADQLVGTDRKCISDDFIREFIEADIDDKIFELILPNLQMANFDITLESIAESRVALMINCKYFEFTAARYEAIKNSFPNLCVEFILKNQTDYIGEIDAIQMEPSLFENLILSNRLEKKPTQMLLDTFSGEHLTARIAENLHTMDFIMDLNIFNAAWDHLDDSGQQKLMLEHLELLDADALYSCFTDLERLYSGFLDRSRQHIVELEDTPPNRALASRLKEVDYITSSQLKDKREYDPVTEDEKVKTVVSCRVKINS